MSCDNMKPYACGGSMNPNTVQNPCDRSLHFEGADDVTINQGVGIDLTEGVHAYDAHGNEIEYTVEPDSIEKCEVGDHVITYTATGEGSRSVPTMCGETALYARACNIITEIKQRIITILQSANPIIRGLSDVLIQPDETFAPLSGVTAEDANGNELTVSYSGRYTDTAEGDIATFDTPYAEPMVSLVADIDPIQDTSGGAPSPSHICPISGWDSVDVSVCGANVWNEEWEAGAIANSSGQDSSLSDAIRSKGYIAIKPSTQYYAKTPTTIYIRFYDANKDYLGSATSIQNKPSLAFTTPDTASYMRFYVPVSGSVYGNNVSINYPSTITSYEPFVSSDTITTTLPQTVYGGTLDVVSGVLTVDRAMVTLNTASMDSSEDYPGWRNRGVRNLMGAGLNNIYNDAQTNVGRGMGVNTIGSNDVLLLLKSQYDLTQSQWQALAIDAQIIVPLATPTTIQLTPQQIDSLLGRNSVWADSGDVTVWYVDEIPQSAFSYPVRGTYTITYATEDECGNRTEKERTIQVGAETFRTVIYEDKTLIINERSSDMEENEHLHGRAEYVYDAMDNDHPYVFSSPEDAPWDSVSGYPERVEFGSEVHPTSTAYWFYGMNQVNTFDLTNLDTSNVTDMKYMFYGCEQILNLAPELDTYNVTDMSHMFERCLATPEIDVSSFDTSNVTDMSFMFASCYNLQTIYAKPTFVTDNVTTSNLMFGYDVHLVGGMGTPYDSNYEDKTYARIDDLPQTKGYFTDKDHITEWFRTAIHYDGTLIINESSFDQTTNRQLHGDAVAVYPPLDADHDYVFYTTLGGGSPYDVYWYQNRNNIKSVKIGSPIKPTNTAFWFNACDKITEIDFTNMDTSDVTEMGWMFFGCSKLNEIEFGDSFDTGNVFNFTGTFQACSELESVDLSGFDTSSATLMGSMFNSDSSLKTIYASDAFVTDNVTSSSDMFSGCTSLVGGSGTVYNQNKTDAEYARIDNPPDEPGYFTSK